MRIGKTYGDSIKDNTLISKFLIELISGKRIFQLLTIKYLIHFMLKI